MGDLRDSQLAPLWQVVRTIPPGSVASYGAVGRALPNAATGYMVGRWMAACPADVPWWRVVNKRGELPINKRDPRLATDQQSRLEAECVKFEDGRISPGAFWEPEEV